MLSKLRTLTVACSVAVLAMSAGALACDKDKQVAAKTSCGSKTAVVQVADGTKQCSKSRQASTIAVAEKTAGCAKSAATKETMALLAKAISAMKSDDCRTDVIAAYRTLAEANPNLVCEKQASTVKAVALASGCCASKAKTTQASGKSACSSTKTTQASNTKTCDPAACRAAKATQASNTKACDPAACRAAKATQASNTKACDPAACRAAKATQASNTKACDPAACRAAKATQASNTSACSKSARTGYVAFGCRKTDRLARAAANSYLQIMRELKAYTGADVCAASTASKLLAQVLEEQSAQASAVEVETVANVETPVSLGAVADKKSSCSKN